MLTTNRRGFLAGGAAAASMAGLYPAWAETISRGSAGKGFGTLAGNDLAITIASSASRWTGGPVMP